MHFLGINSVQLLLLILGYISNIYKEYILKMTNISINLKYGLYIRSVWIGLFEFIYWHKLCDIVWENL
jgi:hypothetical protein